MTARRRKPAPAARSARRAPDAAPASARSSAGLPAPVASPAAKGATPVSWSPDAPALAAAVLGPLALYIVTLPRTVVLEDDGLFLMAGVHLGVAHPPGYPIYTSIVHLFTRLPFGDAAVLGHLSSAVLGALACGTVYGCARLLRASPVPALTAAWLFGVSEQFWSQAIIAEVYTLHALLFFAVYALVLLGARDPGRQWFLSSAAVAWGAGLANHWPLMVLATPGLVLTLLPVWRDVLRRLPRLLGLSLASAALPYAWMVWLSHQAPLISFYGSIDTWSDFWFFVSREGYSGVDVSPSAGWSDRWSFLEWFARDLVRQSTLPGFALALLGLGTLLRPGGSAAVAAGGGGGLALLGNSLALILLLGFDFDEFQVAVFRPYPLICYGVSALWVGVGLQRLLEQLQAMVAARWPERTASDSRASWAVPGPAAMVGLAGAAMVGASASASWPANDRSGSDFVERYAEVLLDALPEDAVLLVNSDTTTPLGYYLYVEERRPDVTLYQLQGLVYANRLFDPFMSPAERPRALDRFVDSTANPVFVLRDADFYPGERAVRHYGFALEMMEEGTPNTIELARHPHWEEYFLELLDRQPADRWERALRYELLYRYGYYLGLIALSGSPELLEPMEVLFERAEDCYPCLISMVKTLHDNDIDTPDRISAWLARAESLHHQAARKGERARLSFEQGRLAESAGDTAAATARYRESHAIYPHPQNPAGDALRRLGLAP